MVVYMLGVVGNFAGGLIEFIAINWIPLGSVYYMTYVKQILVGIVFIGIYYVVFKTLILKFDIKTPGREDDEEVKFFSKADYKQKKGAEGGKGSNPYIQRASDFLDALGGPSNIKDITNCATRLRLNVNDISLVQDTAVFKAAGAHGLVVKGNAIQVIVGMDVANVRDEFESLMAKGGVAKKNTCRLNAPVEGVVIPLNEMKDEAFASGSMGPGVGIIPEADTVCAPIDGTVAVVFDTKHVVGLVTEDGKEILIHIGVDTVELGGEGFNCHVKQGDSVKAGTPLITFDRKNIGAKGYDTTVAVIITNGAEESSVLAIPGKASTKDCCMEIQ